MYPFLPYLPPIGLDVDAFCAIDPPDPPDLTEATMAAVLAGGELGAGIVAAQLILDVIKNQLWYQLCKCDSGTQPTAPVGQDEPPDIIHINPPTVVTPNPVTACATASSSALTPTIFAAAKLIGVRLSSGGGPPYAIPSGATMVRITSHNNSVGATHKTMQFNYWPYPTATLESSATSWQDLNAGSSVHDILITPGAYGFAIDAQTSDGSATTNTAQVDIEVYCGGQPGQTVDACCPPDPQLTGLITRVLEYVTLIQRQVAPFAYVLGDAHSGLADDGDITVSGLLGVSVDITTLPDSYGRAEGSPVEYFGLGFVSFGTADGYRQSFRLEHDKQLILPAVAAAYTLVGYSLAPGIVVTITEVLREP